MDRYRRVYADNAATTPVAPEVIEVINRCFTETYGNPSSLHEEGQHAQEVLEDARQKVASLLGCKASELFFTSSGSESDNWAIKGAAHAAKKGRNKIITTNIEHPAVLNTCKALEKEGFVVKYIPVHENGIVDMDELAREIDETTILVTVMYANNEIGTIQPIKEITALAHHKGALMFTDAVQAVGTLPINIHDLDVDMLSFSGHKINAPKGIGGLFIRKGVRISNLIHGGGQEKNKRAGTENIPYIVGLAKALELAVGQFDDMERVKKMRDKLIEGLTSIPNSKLNGDRVIRLPGNVNISFEFIEGESLLLWLNQKGIAASTGSACSSKSLEPSHVLLATGLPVEMAHGSLRISLSHLNTNEDVEYILKNVPEIVDKLRAMSPIYPGK